MLGIVWSFLKRDFSLYFAYRFSWLSNVFVVLSYAGTFYYVGRLFGDKMVGPLEPFGGDYFSYVLIGIALSNFVGGPLGNLSHRLRQEQLMGTLETLFLAPVSNGLILFAMNLWNFLLASLDMVLYLLAGAFVFNVSFAQVNWLSFLTVLVLTVISFTSLGTITACLTLLFKGGHGLAGTLNVLCDFLGGIYFPVHLLPWWLKGISYLLPITYAVQGANKAIYMHASLLEIKTEISILALFSLVLLFLSLSAFRLALNKSKQYGNLTHY